VRSVDGASSGADGGEVPQEEAQVGRSENHASIERRPPVLATKVYNGKWHGNSTRARQYDSKKRYGNRVRVCSQSFHC
jgi:hypothetical protein